MDFFILEEIKTNDKLLEYLRLHSYWASNLIMNSGNYQIFLNEFKKQKRSETFNKVNDAIDNLEMLSNLL